MSASDKTKLEGIESGSQVNVIESVKVNGTALTPTSKAVDVTIPTNLSDLTNDSGYVKNTDYATGTGGVVKSGAECFKVDSIGRPYCDDLNYATYQNISDTSFMSKGTLESVLAERQKKIDYYESLIDQIIPTTTGEGTDISLNTIQADMSIDIKGNTTQDTSILPSGYQQVEYIESTGPAYIDTGIIPNTNTKIDISFNTFIKGNYGVIFGGEDSYMSNAFHLYNSSGNFDIGFGAKYSATQVTYDTYTKYIFVMDKSGFKLNDTTGTFSTNTISTTYSIYLFAVHRATNVIDSNAQKRIYYCKIYDNGTLVRDMIPCYKTSDSTIGMYDLVNNVFYTNVGTGTFTKGNDVGIPNPDYPQDINVVTGEQEVKVENVNLLNYSKFVKGRINSSTGQIEYASNTSNISTTENTISFTTTQAWNSGIASEFMQIDQGSYTYSIKSATLKVSVYIDLYDKDQNFISRLGNKVINVNEQTTWQVTISNTSAKYIRLHYEMGYANTITLTETQLEKRKYCNILYRTPRTNTTYIFNGKKSKFYTIYKWNITNKKWYNI